MARKQQTNSPVTEQDAFSLTLERLNKEFGDHTVIRMSERTEREDVEVIPTGSIGLNQALGVGGYPTGRIVEIYGPEGSGKTTLCLHAIREAQKAGKKAAIIDMEHSLDLNYAIDLGVIYDDLILSQPDYGEQALNILKTMIISGQFGVIVVDSVTALVPKSELEGEIGDSSLGKQARMMSQMLRIINPLVQKHNVLVIFTNQLRDKIGVMFGSPETTTGGNALKYFASIRIDIRKQPIKDGDEIVANKVKAKVVKSKVAPPYKMASFNINFGEGIDTIAEIVDFATLYNILKKSGSWYSYDGVNIAQGEAQMVQLLKDNEELKTEIETKLKEKMYE